MTRFGYHASHEQHHPRELLQLVQLAEQAGFEAAMCSDHFHPWTPAQGHSGFAWSWLAAALETTSLDFGTVNAPGYRYHPAIIAQAAATLAEMYPGRFWFAAGSGEALNELITGGQWGTKPRRNKCAQKAVEAIRDLWAGETVTRCGLVNIQEATLYTRPAEPPMIYGAALTPQSARAVGEWADGLMTVGAPPEKLREMLDAFAEGGGEGKPVKIQHALSWAPSREEALRGAHEQWRFSALGPAVLSELRTPEQFEAASRFVSEDDVAEVVRVSADLDEHVEWLTAYVELGIETVYLFNVNKAQRPFIEAFADGVLPKLRAR